MEPLEVGMYVRTKGGTIGILGDEITPLRYEIINSNNQLYSEDNVRCDNIKKTSNNIIDLIEVGDYVNGKMVSSIGRDAIYFGSNNDYITKNFYYWSPRRVETIVTKEQFEEMAYRI